VKLPEEGSCEATLDKLVVSVWPSFSDDGHYLTSVCNVSATVHVAETSRRGLDRLLFLLPASLCVLQAGPSDISHTLLDGQNPLTYSTQGRYLKEPGADRLLAYDGVPDVAVDCAATIVLEHRPGDPMGRINVRFSRSIAPGETTAVRFCFEAPHLFAQSDDGALHFAFPIQDDSVVRQFVSDDVLEKINVPVLTVGDDEVSGGADVFFYVPLDFEGEHFTIDPVANLLPDYDHLGRRMPEPRRKFAWTGKSLFGAPGASIALGQNVCLAGVLKRRRPLVPADSSGTSGPILINSRVTGVVQGAGSTSSSGVDTRALLKLVDRLREEAEPLPAAEADLVKTHANGLETAVRSGDLPAARRRLGPLRKLGGAVLTQAPKVLDVVERIERIF
jgi:hypothetical protein